MSADRCRHGLPGGRTTCALCLEAEARRVAGAPRVAPQSDGWAGRLVRERKRAAAPFRRPAPRTCAACGLPVTSGRLCDACADLQPCPRCGLPSGGDVCLPCSRLDHVGAADGWLLEGLEALRADGRKLIEWASGRAGGRFGLPGGIEHACRLLLLAEIRT